MPVLTANSLSVLFLILRYASAQHDEYLRVCQNLNILMVRNYSTGMQIFLTSTTPNNFIPSNRLANVSNHYLPPECGNHHCDILHFESSGYSYYIIPSIRGFVVLSISSNNYTDKQDLQTSFISITEACNPVQAFYAGPAEGRNYMVVACMNLQTRPHGLLYYLQYRFTPSNTGRGLITRNTELLSLSEPIYNPDTVSKVIYVRGQERCAEYDNLYFLDDTYIVHYPSYAFDPEFSESNEALKNCNDHPSIEYYGNDSLLIRCSNNYTVLYDSCASRFTYQPPDYVPYPCTNWDNSIIYRNGRQLTLQNRSNEHTYTVTLPFSDLIYGKCVQEGNHLTFIAQSADGAVFIAPFNGAESRVIKISSGNCLRGSKTCHKPVFSENKQVFGVFESATDTLVIVNLMEQTCKQRPNIINISASFTPELISITQERRVYNCTFHCGSDMPPQPFNFTTAAMGISMKEDIPIQSPIPLTTLIPMVVAIVIVVVAIFVAVALMVIVRKHHKSEMMNNSEASVVTGVSLHLKKKALVQKKFTKIVINDHPVHNQI